MVEYKELEHMIEMVKNLHKANYLPHHRVINASITTTKLRVMFDDSSASSTGYSFNDIQYTDPVLPADICSMSDLGIGKSTTFISRKMKTLSRRRNKILKS